MLKDMDSACKKHFAKQSCLGIRAGIAMLHGSIAQIEALTTTAHLKHLGIKFGQVLSRQLPTMVSMRAAILLRVTDDVHPFNCWYLGRPMPCLSIA